MNIALCNATAEILEVVGDFKHPSLTYARFIFADDKPNHNGEGIEYADFPQLIRSAVDMPIKINFLTSSAGGHKGSVPIGHIRSLTEATAEDGTHQLIAEAVLYAKEYPAEVEFLKEAYASGKAPGISWEISYKDTVNRDGTSWLKGIFARAATFVNQPAYGKRTALLALASSTDINGEQMGHELSAIASEFITIEGGISMDEKKEKELTDQLEAVRKELAEISAAKAKLETDLKSAQAEVASKDEVINQYEKNILVETRTKKVAETGLKIETDAEKLKTKQEFWANLSEEAFAEYVLDLAAATKTQKVAVASLRTTDMPKFDGQPEAMDFQSLKNRMGGLSSRVKVPTE